jgi:hypothetical protein
MGLETLMAEQPAFESVVVINRETVTLRLHQQEGGLLLERELVEENGNKLTQLVPLCSPDTVRVFMEGECYRSQLAAAFEQITARADAAMRAAGR